MSSVSQRNDLYDLRALTSVDILGRTLGCSVGKGFRQHARASSVLQRNDLYDLRALTSVNIFGGLHSREGQCDVCLKCGGFKVFRVCGFDLTIMLSQHCRSVVASL